MRGEEEEEEEGEEREEEEEEEQKEEREERRRGKERRCVLGERSDNIDVCKHVAPAATPACAIIGTNPPGVP